MSRYCSACGGLLGRDCFNEQDCLEISEINRQYEILEGAEVKKQSVGNLGKTKEVLKGVASELFLFLNEIL